MPLHDWNPVEQTKKQYESVTRALEEVESQGQGIIIESNGAKRAVTKADYQWLQEREKRLFERLNLYSGRGRTNLYPRG